MLLPSVPERGWPIGAIVRDGHRHGAVYTHNVSVASPAAGRLTLKTQPAGSASGGILLDMRRARILLSGLLCAGILWSGPRRCTTPASAQPPSPPARVAKPAQPELHIDWRQLSSRPRVWSRPIGSAEPRVSGDQILVLEPSQRAVSALEPQQGRTRWTLDAPAGVTWGGFTSHGRNLLLLEGSHADGRPVLSRISPSGKLLWHITLRERGFVSPADIGTGLLLQEQSRCRQVLLDGESGSRTVPELLLRGHSDSNEIERLQNPQASGQCALLAQLHLWHSGLAILSSASKRRGQAALVALPPGESEKPRWSVAGSHFRAVRIDGDDAIFFRAYPKHLTGGNGANRGRNNDSKAARSHRL